MIQLWLFLPLFRHFSGTTVSTKLGGSSRSFPADPPQSSAGGTGSSNDVRPPCHHYCFYFVLDTPASNETLRAYLTTTFSVKNHFDLVSDIKEPILRAQNGF
jgi:hypothetical protein